MSLTMPAMPSHVQQTQYPRIVEQQDEAGLGIHTVAQALARRWKLAFGLLFLVIALVAVYVFTAPRMYESEMKVLVQNERGNLVVTPERTLPSPVSTGVTEEQVNSEIEVLRSQELAEKVVAPDWNPNGRTQAEIKKHQKLVEQFRKNLAIDAVRKSNIIHVAVRAKSPQQAQQLLQTLLVAYLAKEREIERPAGASSFFEAQASAYKNELEAAQRQLATLQQQTGVVSLPETETTLEKQVTDLNTEQRATELQLMDARDRLNNTQIQMSSMPVRQRTLEKTVPYQLSVEQLTTLLAQLKIKREELITKFQPTDRLVTENQHEIDSTNVALAEMHDSSSQERSTDVNPVWQQLTSAAALTATQIKGLEGKLDGLRQQVSLSEAQLASLESKTVQFSAAKHHVDELENDYQLYTQKRDEAQIADAMDEHKMLNVAIAELPTLSFVAVSPKPVSDLLLGTLTAVFLACGAVFYFEISRSTFASARELEMASSYPVLATVPLVAAGIANTARGGSALHAEASPAGAGSWSEVADLNKVSSVVR